MRAILIKEFGPIASHEVVEVPDPEPGAGEVLIDVHAIGLNFPDALMLQGKYQKRPDRPFVPGRDAAGIVAAVGSGVTRFKPGDRVMAQVFTGAFAERVAAPEKRCFPLADDIPFADAAALTTVFNTAYIACVVRGQAKGGETALVTGAAGGVGLVAVQLLKSRGLRVIAAVSTPEKAALAQANGADATIASRSADLKASFRTEVAAITGAAEGRGVDLAIDTVGGDAFEACLRVLAFAGRLVIVGFSSGAIPAAKANYLLYNNLSVIGAPLDINFDRALHHLEASVAEMQRLYRDGRLKANIMASFGIDDFKEAFRLIEGREVKGKVVLTIGR